MIVTRGIRFKRLFKWTMHHIFWLFLLMGTISLLYYFQILSIHIPWLPVSVIGTAVAFYVGFKNNQAYDRMWEARKIWGGIVNDSRAWGMMVDSYISNLFREHKMSDAQIKIIKRRLIYRHISWLYVHRRQLLIPTPWEHISQEGGTAERAKKYQKKFGLGLLTDEIEIADLKFFLPENEYDRLTGCINMATQIINEQSRDLAKLREQKLLDDFRQTQMESILRNFYVLQGKNERIKKFPLPRQYANISRYFVFIFIMFLPFSMVPELMKAGEWGIWLSVPITALIGWIYVVMERTGDYTENPFQGMANDIPMMSLCRTIEIDLREMLGETNLPSPVKSQKGVLM